MPAHTGLDEEIVRVRTIFANLSEGDAQSIGTNAGSFRQDLAEIALAESKAAECGESCLLPK